MTTSSIASFVFTATQLTQNNKMTKKSKATSLENISHIVNRFQRSPPQ